MKHLTKETALDKILTVFCKLEIQDCIEVYQSAGSALHDRITEHQKNLDEQHKKLE